MRALRSKELIAWVVACSCAALATVPMLARAGWDPTVLPRVDSRSRLGAYARALDHGFKTVHPGAYDGQFYWGIAIDPFARGSVHTAFDKASYRYGHPLYGWVAWVLSAGRARAAAIALVVVGVVSFGVAVVVAMWIGRRRGGVGWEALFVALNAGLLTAVAHDLAEPLAAATLLGAILAYLDQRRWLVWILLAALPLAKEPLLIVIAAFALWEAARRRPRQAAIFATAGLPALGWWIYLRLQLGAWFTTGTSALAAPFTGWWSALAGSGRLPAAGTVVLVLLLLAFAATAVYAISDRGPIAFAYLGLLMLTACLAPNATAAFTTALRNTALLMVLMPFVRRTSLARTAPGTTTAAGS